jgi:hypothetical protein
MALTTIVEIEQTIWLKTPKGQALAKFMIDRGAESDLQWVCIQQDTGEIWTWSNWDVRVMPNITMGREANNAPAPA